tara:strand:+ start:297 stop:620 length:324 start_codon:yes stop_codon:yes gene_type:complete
MAWFNEHCEECQEKLGERFEQVHRWLDELARKVGKGKHRSARHHKDGVEEVRKKWGDKAAQAAELHIMTDYGTKVVPTANQSQMWSLFGPDKVPEGGKTFPTDEGLE